MLKKSTLSALVLAVAIISAPAQASVKQTVFDNNLAKVISNITALDIGYALTKNNARSPKAAPVVVAWSIKSVAKKVGKGVKKVAKKVGKTVKKGAKKASGPIRIANGVAVPSEIRNGASWAYRNAKRGGRHIGKAAKSYGKCLTKGCGRIGDLPIGSDIHDHRR